LPGVARGIGTQANGVGRERALCGIQRRSPDRAWKQAKGGEEAEPFQHTLHKMVLRLENYAFCSRNTTTNSRPLGRIWAPLHRPDGPVIGYWVN